MRATKTSKGTIANKLVVVSIFSWDWDARGIWVALAVCLLQRGLLLGCHGNARGAFGMIRVLYDSMSSFRSCFFVSTTKRHLSKQFPTWISANRAGWSPLEKMAPNKPAH